MVLIAVPSIRCLSGQIGIGVSLPPSTQVDRFENPADLIAPRQAEGCGVILTVAYVGKGVASEQWSIEGPWSAQTVDSEKIVSPVLPRPFPVIDKTGRDLFLVEIRGSIGPDDHGIVPVVEAIHDPLEGRRIGVEIVGVELDGESAAVRRMDRLVPASPNEKIPSGRGEKDKAGVSSGQAFQNSTRPVR